jgi:thiol:disulfide interchange protein
MIPPYRSFGKVQSFALAGLVVLVDFLAGTAQLNSSPVRAGLNPDTHTSCAKSSCSTPKSSVRLTQAANVPTGKPRLLEFASKHCASCGRMAPIIKSMERNCTARDGTIMQIDVDGNEGEVLAERYGVNLLPTFVMIDSNGDEVGRLTGEQPRQQLAVALADVNGVLCATL